LIELGGGDDVVGFGCWSQSLKSMTFCSKRLTVARKK